ncbi:MAG: VCBS repeat-containing protein [Thermoplasmata archaeon]|nr:MAG: VCBS repeat-containing protein [Thermoplasmata archaeon]
MPNSFIKISSLTLSFLLITSLYLISSPARADIDSDYLGSSPGRFNSIKALDIDGDDNIEVVMGNYDGYLNIIESRDGSYFEEWRSKNLGHRLWGLEIADCDSDGTLEIITGNGEGIVYIFDAISHKQEWKSEGEDLRIDDSIIGKIEDLGDTLGRDAHGIAVGNVDDDENLEIVIGTGYKTDTPWGRIYIVDGKTHKIEGLIGPISSRHRGVVIDDIDLDGENEIIFGSGVSLGETAGEGYIYIYGHEEGDYIREWKSEDLDGDVIGLKTYDLDGDGNLEIIAGNGYRYNQGYCFIFKFVGEGSSQGTGNPPIYQQVWESEDIGPKAYGLDVGDIDGDGIVEIVIGNQPGYIWIFDSSTHEIEWKSQLLGTDILGIEIADVDYDGEQEIIACQGGYVGKSDWTSAYTTPHIYIINGKTHEIEFKLGEPDYMGIVLQAVVILLVVVTLININLALRAKKPRRKMKMGSRRGIT